MSRKNAILIIAPVILISIILAGCMPNLSSLRVLLEQTTEPTTEPAAEPTPVQIPLDACSYISQEEAQKYLDADIAIVLADMKTLNSPVTPASSCSYYGGLDIISVLVAKPEAAGWQTAESDWFTFTQGNGTTTVVNNLGSKAQWVEDPNANGDGFAVSAYPYLVYVKVEGALANSIETYKSRMLELTNTLLTRLK